MRSLFNSAPDTTPVPAGDPSGGGWNGLSGKTKIGILGGVAIAAMTAVMWPGFNSHPPPPPTGLDRHPPAPVAEYDTGPPPVQDVIDRVLKDAPPATKPHGRPVPTEMSLYAAPKPLGGVAAPAVVMPAVIDPNATPAGLPTTNRAVLVRNPDYLIRAGDHIPCLPIEASNSSRPSFVTCQVPKWFRSTNQRRGLLPPQSRMFGEMRTGLLAGEERLGIVYTVIQTPNFDMSVNAPAADAMGRGGLDADVQTFFWERAGAVALYALMDIGIGAAQGAMQSAMSRSNSNNTSINIQGPSQSLASRQFDATINKPPVGTRDQALPIIVTVGQNLDFYDACLQAQRVDPMACPKQ